MNIRTYFILTIGSFLLLSSMALAQDDAPAQTVFTNVHIFDGKSEERMAGNVLVEGNKIKQISEEVISAPGATVVDGGGRTLMPGLIENHAHLMLMGPTLPAMESGTTWEDYAIHASAMAEMYLMQGFTTVRDAGGTNGGVPRAINAGIIDGPRVYPSAAFLGGRGGHADFANFTSLIGDESNMGRLNMSREVDGADAMLKAARNNFRMGATQLKVMQSGGVVSAFDPWEMEGRTIPEIEAAVEIASQYGSYAMAHSYKKASILRALDAGVMSIEHGFGFDCDIAKVMKKKGAYITTNLTAFAPGLLEIPAVKNVPASLRKAKSASATFAGYVDNITSAL